MTALKQYRIRANSKAELVRHVEAAVASGALTPGQRLPSVRRLAVETGLSPVTVAAGFAELRRRGVVVSEPRRATRIGPGPPVGSPRAPLPVPPGARDLSRGNPDPALLPDLGAALARCELPARLYGEPQVLPELLALARAQLRADGVPGEELCIAGGAMDAIERVMAAHLRPGDRVAVENPGYAALYDVLRAHGLVLEPVALDQLGMLPADLHRALTRGAVATVITPRGQNPTGAALDLERARRAARRARRVSRCAADRGRSPRGRRRHAAAHAAGRSRASPALGRHTLGRQGARSRPAPRGARRRPPHDRAGARTPAVRARLGQPHPADARARALA